MQHEIDDRIGCEEGCRTDLLFLNKPAFQRNEIYTCLEIRKFLTPSQIDVAESFWYSHVAGFP